MRYTNLAESAEYAAAREALRAAELELVRTQEQVAQLRRALPSGPTLADYELVDAASGDAIGFDTLFSAPGRALIVYHLMSGKLQAVPCPMCTMWVDGFDAVVPHVSQNADVAVVAAADAPALREHARSRGWSRVRLLSAGSSSFKLDMGSEDEQGNQLPKVSVFTRDDAGSVHHFYSGSPELDDDVHERGIDALCATWQLLDLTPGGRGDWYASLDYG